MTEQQNCRCSPFMQLKNNKKWRNYLVILKKSVFHVKCGGFIVLQPEERTCCEVLWDDSRYVCLSDSSRVNRGVAFLFFFLFFSCALGPDTSLVSQKLGTTLVLVIFWEILITAAESSPGVYMSIINWYFQSEYSVVEVNKNWSFKPVALMFWPPFILFICLFTMFEKWLVNQPSINWQIQVPSTWQQQPLKAS